MSTAIKVKMLHSSPNHRKGQIGTAMPSPPGSTHTNPGLMWVDYGEEIVHSHGPSGSTGEWCGPSEYTVLPEVNGL